MFLKKAFVSLQSISFAEFGYKYQKENHGQHIVFVTSPPLYEQKLGTCTLNSHEHHRISLNLMQHNFFIVMKRLTVFRLLNENLFVVRDWSLRLVNNYASPSSGEAYRDRRLTPNFEFWVEIFCVPTCFHVRIPKPCLSVHTPRSVCTPRKEITLASSISILH